MSNYPAGDPGAGAFRDYSPGPHAGLDTDPDAHQAPGSIDTRARNALTLGLMSLLLGVLTGIPAIWVGRKALAHISEQAPAYNGSEPMGRLYWDGARLPQNCHLGLGLVVLAPERVAPAVGPSSAPDAASARGHQGRRWGQMEGFPA